MTSVRFKLLAATAQVPILYVMIDHAEYTFAMTLGLAMLAMIALAISQSRMMATGLNDLPAKARADAGAPFVQP